MVIQLWTDDGDEMLDEIIDIHAPKNEAQKQALIFRIMEMMERTQDN